MFVWGRKIECIILILLIKVCYIVLFWMELKYFSIYMLILDFFVVFLWIWLVMCLFVDIIVIIFISWMLKEFWCILFFWKVKFFISFLFLLNIMIECILYLVNIKLLFLFDFYEYFEINVMLLYNISEFWFYFIFLNVF